MSHRKALLAAGAAGALVLAGAAAVVIPATAAAAAGCTVAYQNLNAWQSSATSGGFTTTLAITNLGDPVSHWTLTFTMPAGHTRGGGWNANYTGTTAITATDVGWNGSIGTGATNASVGLQGTWTRSASGSAPPNPFPQPTDFALNGVACTGSTTSPSPSPSVSAGNRPPTITLTSPAPGQLLTAPATINFAATASDPDGTVARVEFLNGTAVVGTDSTTPYTFAWTNVGAGTYTLSARAVDNLGAATTTPPIIITVRPQNTGGAAPALRVSGNKLVTTAGVTYRLLGVNRASAEFACVQGKGMWDSPSPDQATVDAMKAWNIHTVRIPLNEDCWLGTFGTPSGATYQQEVKNYVDLLVANGITPIVEMHWNHGVYTGNASACGDVNATCQKPMPDAQFAPTFWTQVANLFKGNNAVIFDLFNEPYPDAANNFSNPTAAWTCLRDGGTCTGIGYQVAGMQSLVNAVRATGATNVIMVPGIRWTNDLTQWLTYKPTDSANNIMASWHTYNFNACVNTACWNSEIGTVAAQVPLTAGEIGQNTCAHDYIDQVMAWADANGVGYLAWTWNPWGCGQGNVLINDYSGTPTATFGEGFRAHLLTQNP